eukprot:gnl/MRDRNA2_/MRDRNA2_35687_c0_seq1.p1 gnl/MRDRNA2_/MRDRNA2_35687_c0~~gnl/MRDRNA2_/MRDRNA2_35687_c0_seq1.p1  ORF type:complete len:264 (+),score=38.39 gnl/MRDRNA2_/MRDRNA2_35687_c0_seq1:75-866(+)
MTRTIFFLLLLNARFSVVTPDDTTGTCPAGDSSCGGEVHHQAIPNEDFWRSQPNATVLSENPFIVQFDDFLSDYEVKYIAKKAQKRFAPSTTGLAYNDESARTSESAWFNEQTDGRDKVLRGITDRITELTGMPDNYMEPYQVVRYQKGQEYELHHDYEPGQAAQPCGPRIATFFMYMKSVKKGGLTNFPNLHLRIEPKKGRAVLWWNVDLKRLRAGEDPKVIGKDLNTNHQAMVVEEGTKWAVNRWIHAKDFLGPYFAGQLR